jgi:dihydroflavonol-4-reductase
MTQAYGDVIEYAARTGIRLTTIHPAGVYGGLNTGDGITNVIENLLNWRIWRTPMVVPGRFPLVHANSLADAIVSALSHEGPFIVSDTMCDLRTLARALRRQVRSWVPPEVPAGVAYAATEPLEWLGRALRRRPIMSRVQLDFLTAGSEPSADRAEQELAFRPLPLDEGLRRYLADRTYLAALRGSGHD